MRIDRLKLTSILKVGLWRLVWDQREAATFYKSTAVAPTGKRRQGKAPGLYWVTKDNSPKHKLTQSTLRCWRSTSIEARRLKKGNKNIYWDIKTFKIVKSLATYSLLKLSGGIVDKHDCPMQAHGRRHYRQVALPRQAQRPGNLAIRSKTGGFCGTAPCDNYSSPLISMRYVEERHSRLEVWDFQTILHKNPMLTN